MKTLALRIYLTVVAVLLVFALFSAWLAQHSLEHERTQVQSIAAWNERGAAWAELIENSLPPVTAPAEEQARVLLDWSARLRMPMALESPQGQRIAISAFLEDRLKRQPDLKARMHHVTLSDGRTLTFLRHWGGRLKGETPRVMGPLREAEMIPPDAPPVPRAQPWLEPVILLVPPWMAQGISALILALVLLFGAVALGAWPVVNRLTRRLQALRSGVEVFGSGQLQHRVSVEGADEVAALARSFNEAAQRIEDLVTSNRSLLANASHELRSPLARLKMAVSLMAEASPEQAARISQEIHQDIRELDTLVEEVLLASRLDARRDIEFTPVDLLGLATEEAARVGAEVHTDETFPLTPYAGDERLLRRALRNLLENARRYGGSQIELHLKGQKGKGRQKTQLELSVADRGPGVPAEQRERIFEPFYRLKGHAEHAGGVGLGLSLVRQIAERHGGQARCEARPGGGSLFVLSLPSPSR